MATGLSRDAHALAQLQRDALSVDNVLRALKEEVSLFSRMMYKNHSQHRRAAFFKNLQGVKRCLRDTVLSDVKNIFAEAHEVLTLMQLKPNEHHISWKALAGELKMQVDAALRRLAAFSTSAAQLIVTMQKAYKYPFSTVYWRCYSSLEAQFVLTYFMPFALTMNSILARLTVLVKTLLTRTIEIHGGITLVYLNEVTKSNPLRARVTAVQLAGYALPSNVIATANA